ncbi:Translocation protein SEC63-like protein, partial [Stegodyphus mimosarum]
MPGGSKFQYDESGGTFFYFLLSFEALVVIPCTYYFYPRSKEQQKVKSHSDCHCENCIIKNSRLRSKEPLRKAKERFIKFLLLIGWTSLFLTAYKVAHLQHDYVAYDPFEILQIDPGASMAEIKKAYRRLSLLYHPDKAEGDERKFMRIAKAYAALTDEEARKNFEIYGNPDGPGATSFGIALPSSIVAEENSFMVLGLYALVFMVALPVGVGIWWHQSLKFGGDEVLLDTSQMYFYYLYKTPFMIIKRIIMILGASMEFNRAYNSEVIERPSDNIEIPQLIKELSNVGEKNREKPLCFGYSIKARVLLHAHLSRLKLSPALEEDKLYIVKKCPYLLQEFVQCASQLTMLALNGRVTRMPTLDTIENTMKLCACIVQALWDNKSPFLQLPHVTEDMLRHFMTRKRNIRSLRNLACMKSDERRAMLRSLSDDEYRDVMNVLAKFPVVEVDVKSEVLDDEDSGTITACAIVTVTATLYRKDMSTLFDQEQAREEVLDEKDTQLDEENVDMSPKTKKESQRKVWHKEKKKKVRGKVKKKTAASKATAPVKTNVNGIQVPNDVLPHTKTEEKAKDSDSLGESDSDSDRGSDRSSSDEQRNEKNDTEEDAEWEKFQKKVSKKEKALETKSKISHTVHCPFFPEPKQEFWWIYVIDKKKHALITIPYFVTSLVNQEEIELKFTAPPKPGIYTYCVVVRSDSYVDFDVVKQIKLDVKEAKEVDLTQLQWDVSEEEE